MEKQTTDKTTDMITDVINQYNKPKKSRVKSLLPIRVKDVVDRIKAAGYSVKITHFRYLGKHLLKNNEIRTVVRAVKIMRRIENNLVFFDNWINNNGGATMVELEKDSMKWESTVNCSLSDPFIYSKGAFLAFYRVLDQLSDISLQDLRAELARYFVKYEVQIINGKEGNKKKKFFFDGKEMADNFSNQLKQLGDVVRTVEVFQ